MAAAAPLLPEALLIDRTLVDLEACCLQLVEPTAAPSTQQMMAIHNKACKLGQACDRSVLSARSPARNSVLERVQLPRRLATVCRYMMQHRQFSTLGGTLLGPLITLGTSNPTTGRGGSFELTFSMQLAQSGLLAHLPALIIATADQLEAARKRGVTVAVDGSVAGLASPPSPSPPPGGAGSSSSSSRRRRGSSAAGGSGSGSGSNNTAAVDRAFVAKQQEAGFLGLVSNLLQFVECLHTVWPGNLLSSPDVAPHFKHAARLAVEAIAYGNVQVHALAARGDIPPASLFRAVYSAFRLCPCLCSVLAKHGTRFNGQVEMLPVAADLMSTPAFRQCALLYIALQAQVQLVAPLYGWLSPAEQADAHHPSKTAGRGSNGGARAGGGSGGSGSGGRASNSQPAGRASNSSSSERNKGSQQRNSSSSGGTSTARTLGPQGLAALHAMSDPPIDGLALRAWHMACGQTEPVLVPAHEQLLELLGTSRLMLLWLGMLICTDPAQPSLQHAVLQQSLLVEVLDVYRSCWQPHPGGPGAPQHAEVLQVQLLPCMLMQWVNGVSLRTDTEDFIFCAVGAAFSSRFALRMWMVHRFFRPVQSTADDGDGDDGDDGDAAASAAADVPLAGDEAAAAGGSTAASGAAAAAGEAPPELDVTAMRARQIQLQLMAEVAMSQQQQQAQQQQAQQPQVVQWEPVPVSDDPHDMPDDSGFEQLVPLCVQLLQRLLPTLAASGAALAPSASPALSNPGAPVQTRTASEAFRQTLEVLNWLATTNPTLSPNWRDCALQLSAQLEAYARCAGAGDVRERALMVLSVLRSLYVHDVVPRDNTYYVVSGPMLQYGMCAGAGVGKPGAQLYSLLCSALKLSNSLLPQQQCAYLEHVSCIAAAAQAVLCTIFEEHARLVDPAAASASAVTVLADDGSPSSTAPGQETAAAAASGTAAAEAVLPWLFLVGRCLHHTAVLMQQLVQANFVEPSASASASAAAAHNPAQATADGAAAASPLAVAAPIPAVAGPQLPLWLYLTSASLCMRLLQLSLMLLGPADTAAGGGGAGAGEPDIQQQQSAGVDQQQQQQQQQDHHLLNSNEQADAVKAGSGAKQQHLSQPEQADQAQLQDQGGQKAEAKQAAAAAAVSQGRPLRQLVWDAATAAGVDVGRIVDALQAGFTATLAADAEVQRFFGAALLMQVMQPHAPAPAGGAGGPAAVPSGGSTSGADATAVAAAAGAQAAAAGQAPPLYQELSHDALAAFAGCDAVKQMVAAVCAGSAVLTTIPNRLTCNNPSCTNLNKSSEHTLVNGRGCLCGACKLSHFCGKDCHTAHWKAHRPVCKAAVKRQQQQQEQKQEEVASSSSGSATAPAAQ